MVTKLKPLIRESLSTKAKCIRDDHVGVSYYDDLIDTSNLGTNYTYKDYYRFEKGVDSRIEYMTADEYMDMIAKYVFGAPVERVISYPNVEPDVVSKYAEMMRSGTVFNTPYINLADQQQEGRHRMLAMKEVLGPNAKAPVLIVTESDPTDEEIADYAKRKWGDVEWGTRYVKSVLGKE